MPRTVIVTLDDYADATDLYLFVYDETAPGVVLNTGGDLLTAGAEGTFTCTFAEAFEGVADIKVKQNGLVVATGGKGQFDGTSGTVVVDSRSQLLAAELAGFKDDAVLGTTGLVADATAIKAKTDLIGTVRSLIRW